MYCTNCGSEIKEETGVCSKCGKESKARDDITANRSTEILSGPIHNFLCYIGGVMLVICLLFLFGSIQEGEFKLLTALEFLVYMTISVIPYVFLVRNMEKLLGRISIFAIILSPIKGAAAFFKVAVKILSVCCFFMPPLVVFLLFVDRILGDFGYMWIDYSKNPNGKVCFK